MLKKLFVASICFVSLVLSGCATIFSGSRQYVSVVATDNHAEPIPQLTCKVQGAGGRENVLTNWGAMPKPAYVGRGFSDMTIQCYATGYVQQDAGRLQSSINPVTFVNFGLLFFAPIGFGLDVLSGAWMRYPDHYSVVMGKVSTPPPSKS